MSYTKELTFITEQVHTAYRTFCDMKRTVHEKAAFDVVTELDTSIEQYLSEKILSQFPDDRILGEEFSSKEAVQGRTWTIDPIDGTYNMSRGIALHGVQAALYDEGEIVAGVIYLPHFDELYTAEIGKGAYLNGTRIYAKSVPLDQCIVSFGDYPHSNETNMTLEKKIVAELSDKIARVRFYGAACVDFAWVAAGRNNGYVVFTKNKWDIAPGILLCREAGASIRSLAGDYTADSNEVIVTTTEELYENILAAATDDITNEMH